MFDVLRKLFARRPPARPAPPTSDSLSSSSVEPDSPPQSVAQLRRTLRDIGHPEFPFLDRDHSPASRVPCTDFTPFIIDRLQSGDLSSISELMRGILAGNPGLGVGPEWIDSIITEVARADFGGYVTFGTPRGEVELKALFILAGKDGGGREFWIAESGKPHLFSLALSCQRPVWQASMEALQRKANTFIRQMRREAPFWEEYPLFSPRCFAVEPLPELPAIDVIRGLSLASRMHLLHFAGSRVSGSLLRTATYRMRNLGVNPERTVSELGREGLFVPSDSDEGLLDVWSKDDLMQACAKVGAEYRKSWRKDKLLAALREKAPEFVLEAREREGLVTLSLQAGPELRAVADYSTRLEDAFKLLCFV